MRGWGVGGGGGVIKAQMSTFCLTWTTAFQKSLASTRWQSSHIWYWMTNSTTNTCCKMAPFITWRDEAESSKFQHVMEVHGKQRQKNETVLCVIRVCLETFCCSWPAGFGDIGLHGYKQKSWPGKARGSSSHWRSRRWDDSLGQNLAPSKLSTHTEHSAFLSSLIFLPLLVSMSLSHTYHFPCFLTSFWMVTFILILLECGSVHRKPASMRRTCEGMGCR